MTFESIYCPVCRRCYPRNGDGGVIVVPCGHDTKQMVRYDLEVVGRYEIYRMWTPDKWPVRFSVRPDGNGGRLVEHKSGRQKNARLYSVGAFTDYLGQRYPALLAAFEARRDVRRSGGGDSEIGSYRKQRVNRSRYHYQIQI